MDHWISYLMGAEASISTRNGHPMAAIETSTRECRRNIYERLR
jgi:hypothetical protein